MNKTYKKITFSFLGLLFLTLFLVLIQIVKYKPLTPDNKIKKIITENKNLINYSKSEPYLGNFKAKHTLIMFFDYQCPACQTNNYLIQKIYRQYPEISQKIKTIFKPLPLTTIPYSTKTVHKYAYCANQQEKFFEFNQKVLNLQYLKPDNLDLIIQKIGINEKKFKKCLNDPKTEKYIIDNINLANQLHVKILPTFFLDEKQIQTPENEKQWLELFKSI